MLETRTRFKEDCDLKIRKVRGSNDSNSWKPGLASKRIATDAGCVGFPGWLAICRWKPGLASKRIATHDPTLLYLGRISTSPRVGNQDSLQRGLRLFLISSLSVAHEWAVGNQDSLQRGLRQRPDVRIVATSHLPELETRTRFKEDCDSYSWPRQEPTTRTVGNQDSLQRGLRPTNRVRGVPPRSRQ